MKKVILFLLTAALLLSASCGEASVDGKTTTPDSSVDDIKESDSAATETELSDDLGKYDFGGRSFSIYTRTTPLFYPYLDRQEATGDTSSRSGSILFLTSSTTTTQSRETTRRASFCWLETIHISFMSGAVCICSITRRKGISIR